MVYETPNMEIINLEKEDICTLESGVEQEGPFVLDNNQ